MTEVKSVMLAAGGTGGHLFPAFALAEELQRRGVAVDLITDMRGDRYGSGFPARQVYQVPAATLAGRSPIAAAKTAVALARDSVFIRSVVLVNTAVVAQRCAVAAPCWRWPGPPDCPSSAVCPPA